MIVADVEIRSNERDRSENVIDLSLDDDVPSNAQNPDKRSSDDTVDQVGLFVTYLQ